MADGTITLKSGGSAATVDVGPAFETTARVNLRTDIWADSVTIENTGSGSAVVNHRGSDHMTISADGNAGGITIRNKSADNATLVVGLTEDQKDSGARVAVMDLITYGAPVIIENQDAAGTVMDIKNHGAIMMQMGNGIPAQITGNIFVDNGSQNCLTIGGDGFVHADTLKLTNGSISDIETFGTSTWSNRDGTGNTQAAADGVGSILSMIAMGHSTINADGVVSNGAVGGFHSDDYGIRNGDTTITGEGFAYDTRIPSESYTYINGHGQVNGNQYTKEGAKNTVYVMDDGTLTGNVVSDGVGKLDGTPSVTMVGSGANAVINGDLTASNSGTMTGLIMQKSVENGNVYAVSGGKVTYYLSGQDAQFPTLNGDFVSESGGSITASMNGRWNGASTVSGGTTDVTFIDANAVWNVTRDSELTNFTQGAGTVNFPAAASGFTGTTVTVDGNYSSDGGAINMSTVLQGDTSAHDELDIKGDATGTATITFTKVSGYGSETIEGIKVVQVEGASDAVFTKPDSNRLTAGAYIYDLKKVGKDWYLTSQRDPDAPLPVVPDTPDTPDNPDTPEQPDILLPTDPTDPTAHIVKPELGSYAANLLASNTLFTMTLNDRLGETRYSDALKSQKHSGNI